MNYQLLILGVIAICSCSSLSIFDDKPYVATSTAYINGERLDDLDTRMYYSVASSMYREDDPSQTVSGSRYYTTS